MGNPLKNTLRKLLETPETLPLISTKSQQGKDGGSERVQAITSAPHAEECRKVYRQDAAA